MMTVRCFSTAQSKYSEFSYNNRHTGVGVVAGSDLLIAVNTAAVMGME
jgi:hypothetical protein